jgi:peptidoglycan hydrolase-like protein with peptidoglycan-binding domain
MNSTVINQSRIFKFLIAIFVSVIAISNATPTQAYANAFFHTHSIGNRGTDVRTIQYLLNLSQVDGIFGSGTDTAVRNFQASRGLPSDGIVGPDTWNALVPTIRLGNSGNAVSALQNQLNEKRNAGLAVTGVFDSATDTAVRNFQSHAGIGADGIVGPTTWRNLVWHYDLPNFGINGVCDYSTSNGTAANWGTAQAIGQIEAAGVRFAATGNGEIPIGDISLEHGGDIAGHESHEQGIDVDVRPANINNGQCSAPQSWNTAGYDRAGTQAMIDAILDTAPGQVSVIYFNDPNLNGYRGVVRPLTGHDNHLHIRYS